ncbi:MAG TPA: lipoprotein [Pseudolabrys sp.]|nr:lipoprotein [Pseudolabrys sp.]
MRHCERPFLRISLIGALVAALGLAACGRKGPLDPPPGASLAGEQATTAGGKTEPDRPVLGPDGKPIASGNTNKRIPLDVLLN